MTCRMVLATISDYMTSAVQHSVNTKTHYHQVKYIAEGNQTKISDSKTIINSLDWLCQIIYYAKFL